ncbi:hypothetical protein C8Q80DRAFT_1115897 [Daedaleopsis nitida]|nr:hypothetical protein C8Q80DRAFT_1115897 [Daedaleopsis nitida]
MHPVLAFFWAAPLALSVCQPASASFSVSPPGSTLEQCAQVDLVWTEEQLWVVPNREVAPGGPILESLGTIDKNFLFWTVDLPVGQNVSFTYARAEEQYLLLSSGGCWHQLGMFGHAYHVQYPTRVYPALKLHELGGLNRTNIIASSVCIGVGVFLVVLGLLGCYRGRRYYIVILRLKRRVVKTESKNGQGEHGPSSGQGKDSQGSDSQESPKRKWRWRKATIVALVAVSPVNAAGAEASSKGKADSSTEMNEKTAPVAVAAARSPHGNAQEMSEKFIPAPGGSPV